MIKVEIFITKNAGRGIVQVRNSGDANVTAGELKIAERITAHVREIGQEIISQPNVERAFIVERPSQA